MILTVGDKVQADYNSNHKGTVIHQTNDRVLWNCEKCGIVTEDYRDDLHKIPDEGSDQ